jgi:hypothetical protein
LSIPDVHSFVVLESKAKFIDGRETKPPVKKKKGKGKRESDEEITMPQNTGSRTRPGKVNIGTLQPMP